MTRRLRMARAALVLATGIAAGRVSADDGGSGRTPRGVELPRGAGELGTTAWQFLSVQAGTAQLAAFLTRRPAAAPHC